MSTRRKVGDKVWLRPGAGFVGDSWRLPVTIQEEVHDAPGRPPSECSLNCESMYYDDEPSDEQRAAKTEDDWRKICGVSDCPACHDPACREWANTFSDRDPQSNDEQYLLPHVSECEMFDKQQFA